MNESRIKGAFETMHTTKEMDQRILAAVASGQETQKGRPRRRSRRFYHRLALAAAIVLTLFTVFQIPQVATYAESVLKEFTKIFYVQGDEVEMEGKYIRISEDADKRWKKTDGLKEIEKNLNVRLLKYDESYEGENSWDYYAGMIEGDNGPIKEITLTNYYYILGDLKNVDTTVFDSASTVNSITYTSGKIFKTPVSCQIVIKTEAEAEEGEDVEVIPDFDSAEATKYRCKNLGTDVLLYRVDTDGPAAWEQVRVREMTNMVIFYEGIEYHFLGEVSMDTMKEIAENLHY
ncbi:hypothetical protein [Emergencia timonensis]|uniref:hypothetical protein n=1 Tax=Emergencia timonensis TaxID=1776384 RepID=UPI0039920517